ncbi:MAG: hypothetical protein QXD72_01810 [Candidatus Aenigmatarchaeota archaeon]
MTKEDFSLKKDVLQLQKKVTDLELTATELKEGLSKFDPAVLDDLKQRLDDVEDLVMVENAGIIELKKMLEGIQDATQTKELSEELKGKVEELTSKITSLEEKVSTPAPQVDTTQIEELKTNFENLKAEVEEKLSEVKTTTPSVDLVTNEIRREITRSVDWLKTEVISIVEERSTSLEKQVAEITEKLSKLPSPDELTSVVEGFANSFKTFRSSIETRLQTEENKMEERWAMVEDKMTLLTNLSKTMEEFKADTEMKRRALETMISSLEEKLRMPLHERAVRELEKIRNDWIVNNARIDTIETLIKSFERQVENLRPAFKKLETFDKLVNLNEEISQKIEKMKEYYEAVEQFSKKAEIVQLREKLKVFEERVEEIKSHIIESVTQNKKIEEYVEDKVQKEMKRLKTDVESMITSLQDDMSVFQGNLMSLEQGQLDITAAVANLQESKIDVDKKFKSVETEIESLKPAKQELINLKTELARMKKEPIDLREIIKKIDSLEADLKAIKSLKSEDKTNELVNKIKELERKIDLIALPTYDEQITELLNRIVFLESRITAVEGILQDIPRYSPIVVE